MKMPRAYSIYLDFLRFFAACVVVYYHSNNRELVATPLPLASYGHEAVMIFFVLSGFVIAYVTEGKENTPAAYFASRISRIYSLAIPAVLLTPLLDVAGLALNPGFYGGKEALDLWGIRLATSLVFLNEVWGFAIQSFSNVPYWSLNYEVWYYVLFGIWVFTRGTARLVLIAVVCLMLGPKVLLLAPIWLLGVVLFRLQARREIPEWAGWLLALGSLCAIFAFARADLTHRLADQIAVWAGPFVYRELANSRYFLGDWILGVLVFAHLAGVRAIQHRLAPVLFPLEKPIRLLAAYTFSVYIFHQPLLLFWSAVIDGSPKGYGFYLSVMLCTAVSIYGLAFLTEHRRAGMRDWVYRGLTRIDIRSAVARTP
jgi:peptidoglycan/LPS O-acetylase OafA/YrhL